MAPTGGPVADYWGDHRIAARMGVCARTIRDWRVKYGFLSYRRRRGPRWYWYTNDDLIHAWELARCRVDLLADRQKQQARGVKP